MNKISKEDINSFKSTENGKKTSNLFQIGSILLVISCSSFGFISGFFEGEVLTILITLFNFFCVLLSILGTYFVGQYYGSLKQDVLDKKDNK